MNISNIRTVIHFGATSNDRDMYIQGVGMAGRVCKNAIAILLTRKGGKEHIDSEMMLYCDNFHLSKTTDYDEEIQFSNTGCLYGDICYTVLFWL